MNNLRDDFSLGFPIVAILIALAVATAGSVCGALWLIIYHPGIFVLTFLVVLFVALSIGMGREIKNWGGKR